MGYSQQFDSIDTKLAKQKDSWRQIIFMVFSSVILSLGCILPLSNYLIHENYKNARKNANNIISTNVESKFAILDNLNNSLFNYANSIVNSDTFRILLTDHSFNQNKDLFKAQKPYIMRTLQEFVEYNDKINAVRLASNKEVLFQYPLHSKKINRNFSKNGDFAISAITVEKNKVLVDIAINIKDLNTPELQKKVGKLIYTIDISEGLIKILDRKESNIVGSTTSLINNKQELTYKHNEFTLNTRKALGRHYLQTSEKNSFGSQIQFAYDKDYALQDFYIYEQTILTYSILGSILVTLLILSIFWRTKHHRSRILAKQYSILAKRINKQQSMLSSINANVDEQISLKDTSHNYIYANKSFEKFFNIKIEEEKRVNDKDIFYSKQLIETLNKADDRVLKSSKPWIKHGMKMINASGFRYFDISKWPQKDGENTTGIITISRDKTDEILHQQQLERLQNQAIQSLVKTVEIKDPHLAGHHERMAFIAGKIAKKLKLSKHEQLTLTYAASLAGIGKVFVPKALLIKPDALTQEETALIQTHIDSALLVLKNIDFDLPISQTIADMYERLDGSGYPNAKKAQDISQLSRILAVADAFCALIVPRSYRDGKDFNTAIKILLEQNKQYDQTILTILKTIVEKMSTIQQQKLIEIK